MKPIAVLTTLLIIFPLYTNAQAPEGFVSLFNGNDLSGWKIPEGDNGHWKVLDNVIDYDAESESNSDKSLWSEKTYKDFVLYVDWRIKETPWKNPRVPIILPSGLHKRDENGKPITIVVPDSDSGILLRGVGKCQANIWCWPIGSGEVYGYRMDENMPPEVRRGVTPAVNADTNIGEWNTFKITMLSDRMSVDLNGIQVIANALLPDIPLEGPVGLQHHGSKRRQALPVRAHRRRATSGGPRRSSRHSCSGGVCRALAAELVDSESSTSQLYHSHPLVRTH